MIYSSHKCLFALLFVSIHGFLSDPDISPSSISLRTQGHLSRKGPRLLWLFSMFAKGEMMNRYRLKDPFFFFPFPFHHHWNLTSETPTESTSNSTAFLPNDAFSLNQTTLLSPMRAVHLLVCTHTRTRTHWYAIGFLPTGRDVDLFSQVTSRTSVISLPEYRTVP